MSLVVVASALPFRATAVPLGDVAGALGGRLQPARRQPARRLARCGVGHTAEVRDPAPSDRRAARGDRGRATARPRRGPGRGTAPWRRRSWPSAGVVAGFVIGVVASLLGVAGGELLIPTLVLLFGADIKLAGSLSLAVSLPTMVVGFTRYSRDRSFAVLGRNRAFVLVMAAGSIAGSFIGGQMLGIVPELRAPALTRLDTPGLRHQDLATRLTRTAASKKPAWRTCPAKKDCGVRHLWKRGALHASPPWARRRASRRSARPPGRPPAARR